MTEAIWLRFQGGRSEAIQRAINERGEFTATVSKSDVKPRKHQVCLVSLQDSGHYSVNGSPDLNVDYVGVSQSGSLVATDEMRIKVTNLIETGGVAVGTLVSEVPARHRNRVPTGFGAPTRLSPKLAEAVLVALQKRSQSVRSGMSGIRTQLAELKRIGRNLDGDLSALERDAVATSLEIFGGAPFRKEVFRSTQPATASTASFLSRLGHYDIREDTQINFDAITFPGFQLARKHVVGAIEVANSMGQRLTILNCNRQSLEHTLGVDLIYYSHNYRSFVLVQYKRLVAQSGGKPVYRPDSDPNYAIELERMNTAANELGRLTSAPNDLSQYRLGLDAFFFKFCEARQKSSLDAGLISGMYIPLGLWNQFARSKESRGPRGGLRIDWESHPRSLNNSTFCRLLKQGWIGSSAAQTDLLERIIEGTLSGKRMLVLAATIPRQDRPDQLRDDLGRFTDEDDPLGIR